MDLTATRITSITAKATSRVPVYLAKISVPALIGSPLTPTALRAEVAAGIPTRSGQNGPIANSMVRVDLSSAQTAGWYSEANSAVLLLGFATDGSPLVLAKSASGTRLLRLMGSDQVADSHPVDDFRAALALFLQRAPRATLT